MTVLVAALIFAVIALLVREATVRMLAAVVSGVLFAWWIISYLAAHG